ncbi:MAG TPA: tRNA 2-selenouridine(34) synthase MnmH [Burkholderiales bacterium]|nr:tRNA 2-selenouridine(34) synthase MnmH [Burkholderiales bacterium]
MKHPACVDMSGTDGFDEIIDVRSPAEFALDHLPGACNCPVLDDAERARVGTLYKSSPFEARKMGAALVANNIAQHLQAHFSDRDRNWRPLVYCWRGGKRSGSMAHVLREVGWEAATLDGGYQSYRRFVVMQLAELPPRFDFRVVCGPTGSGKSHLLSSIASAGGQVLDLEALARHRGSLLGGLPGETQPSQKMFESLIWKSLRGFDAARPVFVEAESRRIGTLRLPEALLSRMRESRCISLCVPVAERVRFLLAEYRHLLDEPDWLAFRLQRLAALHSRQTVDDWIARIEARDWEALVSELLATHYDPAYLRSLRYHYPLSADSLAVDVERLDPDRLAEISRALVDEA